MFRAGSLAATAVLMASCATPTPVVITNPFSADDLAWSRGAGPNSIKGSALLRTVGGDVKTCAGLTVTLVPKSPYTTERMIVVYGSDTGGISRPNPFSLRPIPQPAAELYEFNRETVCDPQGSFTFNSLPNGTYYVVAEVTWGAPTQYGVSTQGGKLMKSVTVRDGQTAEIVITG